MVAASTYKDRLKRLGCVVVIPTYNNAGTVCYVVRAVQQYADDVIVVNDGSTDNTADLLSAIEGIEVISYQPNQGKGHALTTALKRAYEAGFRYALTIDADGQHFADDIPVFIERIEEVPDSLLVGARNLQSDNMPQKNTFANKFSNFWYKVETGHTLADTQSGYRLYPLDKLQGIHFLTSRYEFEVEIIVRACWRGVNVENVPVHVYYPPVEERVSHFRPLQDFTRISLLNSVLVLVAILWYYPMRFLRRLTWQNVLRFVDANITHNPDSNVRLAAAMGWGIFCGIIPIWGYQMIIAAVTAHLMRLNKVVTLVFSNISIPPMIPFILYGSLWCGATVLGEELRISLHSITMERAMTSLMQYVLGSVVLALVCGGVVFIASYIMFILFRRKPAAHA